VQSLRAVDVGGWMSRQGAGVNLDFCNKVRNSTHPQIMDVTDLSNCCKERK